MAEKFQNNKSILIYIILVFIGWRVSLLFVSFLGLSIFPISTELGYDFFLNQETPNYYLKWANWDGGHFRGIAENGYLPFQVVFFPLYPILIKGIMLFGFSSLWSGLFISHLSAILALYFLFKLVSHDYNIDTAKKVIFVTLAFPTAFYLGAVYAEGLFLAFAVSAFYFARKKVWLLAFLLAGLSCATRLVGLAVIAGIIIEYILQNFEVNKKIVKFKVFKLLTLTLVGLLPLYFYMNYLNSTQGSPFVFLEHEKKWDRILTWPWESYINYLNYFQEYGLFAFSVTNQSLIDFLFANLLIVGLIFSFLKLRLSYSIYFLFALIPPLSSGTFSSIHRYGLVIFPFMVLLSFLKPDYLYKSWIYFSIILLGFFTILFINSFWVT